jgi:sulfite exporter TauE/SafE
MADIIPIYRMLIFWSFGIGILHTLMPCEDKAIFAFYTFGVSRDSKEAFKILTVYGLGLLCSNMGIGSIISVFGNIIFGGLNQLFLNGLAAGSVLISGGVMLVQVFLRSPNHSFLKLIRPHYQQKEEIAETIQQSKEKEGRFRKRTAFLLGILAGIPPCIFESAIYSMAAVSSGLYGMVIVLFFGIGTWIGMFPLAAFGLIGSYTRKKEKPNNKSFSKVELVSALTLISLGIILLLFVIAGIDIFHWIHLPEAPV